MSPRQPTPFTYPRLVYNMYIHFYYISPKLHYSQPPFSLSSLSNRSSQLSKFKICFRILNGHFSIKAQIFVIRCSIRTTSGKFSLDFISVVFLCLQLDLLVYIRIVLLFCVSGFDSFLSKYLLWFFSSCVLLGC